MDSAFDFLERCDADAPSTSTRGLIGQHLELVSPPTRQALLERLGVARLFQRSVDTACSQQRLIGPEQAGRIDGAVIDHQDSRSIRKGVVGRRRGVTCRANHCHRACPENLELSPDRVHPPGRCSVRMLDRIHHCGWGRWIRKAEHRRLRGSSPFGSAHSESGVRGAVVETPLFRD